MPQADSKRRIANKAVLREHVELAREHLIGGYRDALDLQAETGCHVTEVQRFAGSGEIEPCRTITARPGRRRRAGRQAQERQRSPHGRGRGHPGSRAASARARRVVDQQVHAGGQVRLPRRRAQEAVRPWPAASLRRHLGHRGRGGSPGDEHLPRAQDPGHDQAILCNARHAQEPADRSPAAACLEEEASAQVAPFCVNDDGARGQSI